MSVHAARNDDKYQHRNGCRHKNYRVEPPVQIEKVTQHNVCAQHRNGGNVPVQLAESYCANGNNHAKHAALERARRKQVPNADKTAAHKRCSVVKRTRAKQHCKWRDKICRTQPPQRVFCQAETCRDHKQRNAHALVKGGFVVYAAHKHGAQHVHRHVCKRRRKGNLHQLFRKGGVTVEAENNVKHVCQYHVEQQHTLADFALCQFVNKHESQHYSRADSRVHYAFTSAQNSRSDVNDSRDKRIGTVQCADKHSECQRAADKRLRQQHKRRVHGIHQYCLHGQLFHGNSKRKIFYHGTPSTTEIINFVWCNLSVLVERAKRHVRPFGTSNPTT